MLTIWSNLFADVGYIWEKKIFSLINSVIYILKFFNSLSQLEFENHPPFAVCVSLFLLQFLVVGEKEKEAGTVNVRTRDNKVHGEKTLEAVLERFTILKSEKAGDSEEAFWWQTIRIHFSLDENAMKLSL